MKQLNENLSEIFDIQPLTVDESVKENKELIVQSEQETLSNLDGSDYNLVGVDYNLARLNIKKLLKKGDDAIDNLLKVAEESEHPRAYEVAAGFIKTLADLNKDLLDLQKKKKELEINSANPSAPNQIGQTVIDKAVFVGSTQELIKMIKNTKEED